jgi:hypothetical protein
MTEITDDDVKDAAKGKDPLADILKEDSDKIKEQVKKDKKILIKGSVAKVVSDLLIKRDIKKVTTDEEVSESIPIVVHTIASKLDKDNAMLDMGKQKNTKKYLLVNINTEGKKLPVSGRLDTDSELIGAEEALTHYVSLKDNGVEVVNGIENLIALLELES